MENFFDYIECKIKYLFTSVYSKKRGYFFYTTYSKLVKIKKGHFDCSVVKFMIYNTITFIVSKSATNIIL